MTEQASEHGTDLATELGARIREARTARGVTLRDLAGRLGVSPATMSAMENARTKITAVRLNDLANILDVPIDSLLTSGPTRPDVAETSEPSDWRVFEPALFEPTLQGALEAFWDFGYHGATMRDIANRANLSVPGVYHHFDSKQTILQTLLSRVLTEMGWRIDAALVGLKTPDGRFRTLVECIALFHAYRSTWSIVVANELRSVDPAASADVNAERIRAQHEIRTAIEDGVTEGIFDVRDPRVTVRSIAASLADIAQWFTPDGPLTAEEVASLHVDLALNLVKYRP